VKFLLFLLPNFNFTYTHNVLKTLSPLFTPFTWRRLTLDEWRRQRNVTKLRQVPEQYRETKRLQCGRGGESTNQSEPETRLTTSSVQFSSVY